MAMPSRALRGGTLYANSTRTRYVFRTNMDGVVKEIYHGNGTCNKT